MLCRFLINGHWKRRLLADAQYKVTVTGPSGEPTVGTPVNINVREAKEGETPQVADAPLKRSHPVKFECEARAGDGTLLTSTDGVKVSISGPEETSLDSITFNNQKFLIVFKTPILSGKFAGYLRD